MIIWRNLRTADLARLMALVVADVRRQPSLKPNAHPASPGGPSRRDDTVGKRPLASGGNAAE